MNKQTMTKTQLQGWIADKVAESCKAESEKIIEAFRKASETSNGAVASFQNLQQPPANGNGAQLKVHAKGYDETMVSAGVFRTFIAARHFRVTPMQLATQQYGADHPVTKALAANDPDSGGVLIPGVFSSDLIELLRPLIVVEKAGPSRVPLDRGSLQIPKITSGTSATWLGEGTNITTTEPETGTVNLVAHKLAGLVPINNELLRYASIDADRLVRADLVRAIAQKEDLAYLMGDGTAGTPIGFHYQTGINVHSANTTVTSATIADELGDVIQLVLEDNVNILNPRWFIAPRTWKSLSTFMDANSNYIWREEMTRGTILGYPYFVSNQIPTNLAVGAATSCSVVFFVADMADVIIGRASTVEVDASSEAAYHNGSAVVAAFSLDQTVVRAITAVDIGLRHAESLCKLDSVKWGA